MRSPDRCNKTYHYYIGVDLLSNCRALRARVLHRVDPPDMVSLSAGVVSPERRGKGTRWLYACLHTYKQ